MFIMCITFIFWQKKASAEERLKDNPTYRDNDLVDTLKLPPDQYTKFKEILDKDISQLALYELTDYSLLLGIHDPSNPNFKEDWIELWNRSPDQMRL